MHAIQSSVPADETGATGAEATTGAATEADVAEAEELKGDEDVGDHFHCAVRLRDLERLI